MGVLIVIGTAVVVGTIIHRLYDRNSAPPSMPAAALGTQVAPIAATAATLQPGEHIAGIAAAGADVAVWVNSPAGARLLLLDPATGQIRVGLTEAAK